MTKPLRDRDLLDATQLDLSRDRARPENEKALADLRERFSSAEWPTGSNWRLRSRNSPKPIRQHILGLPRSARPCVLRRRSDDLFATACIVSQGSGLSDNDDIVNDQRAIDRGIPNS